MGQGDDRTNAALPQTPPLSSNSNTDRGARTIMSVNIVLSQVKSSWQPGDEVSGFVRLDRAKAGAALLVTISLRAVAKSRFGLPGFDSMYSEKAVLYEETKQLTAIEENGDGHANGTSGSGYGKYPFRFVLQDKARDYVSPFREKTHVFNPNSNQLLPPTFAVLGKDAASPNDSCSIVHYLHASAQDMRNTRSNLFKNLGTIEERSELNFAPFRQAHDPDWAICNKRAHFECRSPLLAINGNASKSKLSVKDRVMSTITPASQKPASVFNVIASIPRRAVAGQPVPIFMAVQHDREQSTAPGPAPGVRLTSFNVKLESVTYIRGQIEHAIGDKYQPPSHSSWARDIDLVNQQNMDVALSGLIDLREHVIVRLPQSSSMGTCPSFSTVNIARSYVLKIRATAECARERFKANFEIAPFIVLAPHPDDEANPPRLDYANFVKAAEAAGEDKLPSWEESGAGEDLAPIMEKEEPPEYETGRYS